MKKIDFHCHAFTERVVQAVIANDPYFKFLSAWNPAERIGEMDSAGVDIQILSSPHLYSIRPETAPELYRETNDVFAESCRRSPDRFMAMAHVPFHNMDAALKELTRALDELGFVGVVVTSNINGRYLDTPDFDPFWAEMNRRRVPVLIHPFNSNCYHDDQRPHLLSWPFDTTLSVTKLLAAGLFDRFPDVVLIVSHLGAAIPVLAHRIDLGFDQEALSSGKWKVKRPPSEYVKKLYVDTALGWGRVAFHCAREQVGIEHIVFGTDHFVPGTPNMKRTAEFLDRLDITPAEREMVYEKNGRRILEQAWRAKTS
jgi:predicted TIM-barrel fold metal-dependent hydrolase